MALGDATSKPSLGGRLASSRIDQQPQHDAEQYVIDVESRAQARQIIRKIMAEGLHPDDVDVSWPKSEDMAVRTIRFWLWTIFDDESGKLVLLDRSDQRQVLANADEFLGTSLPFQPSKAGMFAHLKQLFEAGVEWRGCELPWHANWPFPSKQVDPGSSN